MDNFGYDPDSDDDSDISHGSLSDMNVYDDILDPYRYK